MKKTERSYIEVPTVSDMHRLVRFSPPRHPLISVVDHQEFYLLRPQEEGLYRFGFYTVSCKRFEGQLNYGRGSYDFNTGSLLFTAPGQVIGPGPDVRVDQGWALFFHPDLLFGTSLGQHIHEYSFFHYEVNEALHISEEEDGILRDCVDKITREYLQPIDKHTQTLLVSQLEVLLNYCNRFYDRQFYTRSKVNADIVQRFETVLKDYFAKTDLLDAGLPAVGYFAEKLHLSPNYLSDMLQKFTGKSTMEHIHLELVEKAKTLLWSTDSPISQIAYQLGFEHPSHFTRVFKAKTGKSPSEYRGFNQ